MICRHCGTELGSGDRFCPGCGAPIDAPKAERTPKENTQAEKGAKKAKVTALAAAAQNGDEQSFSELYRMFYQKVFALAKTTVKTDADAEDVLQLTFIRAWNSIGNLKNPEAFSTWIQRITLNQCYSLLRSRHVEVSIDESEDDEDSFGPIRLESDLMLPEVYAERSDLRARLGRIIDGLSSVQKQTITLYYYDGLPVENIAWIMDCSVNTVKSRLFLARKSIKTEIEEQERRSGQPFFGIAGLATVPFGKLFVEHVTTMSIPKAAAANALRAITQHISETAAKSAKAAQMRASTAGSAAKQSAKTAAKGTVKVGAKTVAKAAASAVSKKVITGILAGVLITGAVAGGTVATVHAIREKQSPETIAENAPAETDRSDWRLVKKIEYSPFEDWTDYEIYGYDESGNRVSVRTSDEAPYFESRYDASGNLVREINYDADGSARDVVYYENEYDENGHLIEMSAYDSAGNFREHEVYRYDSHGNMISLEYDSGKKYEYTYEYGADGNVLKKTEYYDGIIQESTEYSANGVIVIKEEYVDGEIARRFIFGADGRLTEKRYYEDGAYQGSHYFKYEYDANGWLTKEIEAVNRAGDLQGWADYTYDAYGNCIMIARYDPTNGRAPDGFMGWTKYEWEYIGSEPLTEVPPVSAAPSAAAPTQDAEQPDETPEPTAEQPSESPEPTAEQPSESPEPTHAEAKTYPPRYQTIAAAYGSPSFAIKNDGTLLVSEWFPDSWTDLVSVAVSAPDDDYTVLGLKSDGTVCALYDSDVQDGVSGWTDIVEIAVSSRHALGRKSNGTVVSCGRGTYSVDAKIAEWTDIVAIAEGGQHSVGLKSDGTVVACGRNSSGECNVSGWTDIVAIAAGFDFTVGVKSDGTVVFCGNDEAHISGVEDWTDIVAVSSSGLYVLGLKKDGTVVSTDLGDLYYYDDGQTQVSGWTDIVAIAAGTYSIGLKSDGTIVVAPTNKLYTRDVATWSGIRMP